MVTTEPRAPPRTILKSKDDLMAELALANERMRITAAQTRAPGASDPDLEYARIDLEGFRRVEAEALRRGFLKPLPVAPAKRDPSAPPPQASSTAKIDSKSIPLWDSEWKGREDVECFMSRMKANKERWNQGVGYRSLRLTLAMLGRRALRSLEGQQSTWLGAWTPPSPGRRWRITSESGLSRWIPTLLSTSSPLPGKGSLGVPILRDLQDHGRGYGSALDEQGGSEATGSAVLGTLPRVLDVLVPCSKGTNKHLRWRC